MKKDAILTENRFETHQIIEAGLGNISQIETEILRSLEPVEIDGTEEISILGHRGNDKYILRMSFHLAETKFHLYGKVFWLIKEKLVIGKVLCQLINIL